MRYAQCLLLFLVTSFSRAEFRPFGLSFGSPADKLEGCSVEQDRSGKFTWCVTKEVPDKDSRFDTYRIAYTKEVGVCDAVATRQFDTRQNAQALKLAFLEQMEHLKAALGKPGVYEIDLQAEYWEDPKRRFESGGSRKPGTASLARAVWPDDSAKTLTPEVHSLSLRINAFQAATAILEQHVFYEDSWRCYSPYIARNPKTVEFNAADLGLEKIGQANIRLTQTTIAPEIFWLQVIDAKLAPGIAMQGGNLNFSLIAANCAIWQAAKIRGNVFFFTPQKPFSGELVAFVPIDMSPASFETKTAGRLRGWTTLERSKFQKLCEDLPAESKLVQ